MLVVKERKGPAAKLDIWKVPTGLLDRAEDFSAGAVREVKEETVCCPWMVVPLTVSNDTLPPAVGGVLLFTVHCSMFVAIARFA
jgi:ADP-ribose pyrophosphatase YjhB (NUDIX family)